MKAKKGESADDQEYHARRSSGGNTERLARNYFSTLTKKQLLGLKHYYRHDLAGFQYDPDILDRCVTKQD